MVSLLLMLPLLFLLLLLLHFGQYVIDTVRGVVAVVAIAAIGVDCACIFNAFRCWLLKPARTAKCNYIARAAANFSMRELTNLISLRHTRRMRAIVSLRPICLLFACVSVTFDALINKMFLINWPRNINEKRKWKFALNSQLFAVRVYK